MPAPLQEDLRQKAIAAVERGERAMWEPMLNISRNTLDFMAEVKEQMGSSQAITHYHREIRTCNWLQRFREICDGMEVRLKGKWLCCGEIMWASKTSVMPCGLGLNEKKRHMIPGARWVKRQAFQAQFADQICCPTVRDEAGIDNRDDYAAAAAKSTTLLCSPNLAAVMSESVDCSATPRKSVCTDDICWLCNRNCSRWASSVSTRLQGEMSLSGWDNASFTHR